MNAILDISKGYQCTFIISKNTKYQVYYIIMSYLRRSGSSGSCMVLTAVAEASLVDPGIPKFTLSVYSLQLR